MSSNTDSSHPKIHLGWLSLLLVLWLQLFAACVYAWRFGEYYDYGWYVPPLFAMFMLRIRGQFSAPREASNRIVFPILALVGLGAGLFFLRVIQRVDPRWTLPIWIHALVVIGITLFAAYNLGGARAFRRTIPIIIFACSAIPLPTLVENFLVSTLTDGVISSSAALLQLLGMHVQTVGDRLGFMDEVVEVTEGCSGIRSAQSFLMSSLFFGELMKLRAAQRVVLVLIGIAVAWVLNVVRASSLAAIQFRKGQEAFDSAHDNAGLLAFLVGSVLLLAFSSWIGRANRGTVVHRRIERREV